jgi:uncharacterized membrane-anchored protein YitT (DUF2179 family)
MGFLHTDKLFSRTWFINWMLIIFGSFIMAAGYVFFITPHKIVPGGVYGISIVIHHLTEGVFSWAPEGLPVGLVGLIMNIPLTIIGIRVLGPRFGVKTIFGFFLTAGFIDLQTLVWGNRALVPDEVLLSCVYGAVMIGFGLGLIFRSKATSGGSDIVAMIISKYTKLPLGQLLIYVDSVIVLVGLIAFRDWKIPLYSWLTIFITGKVIDATLIGANYNKSVFIVSGKYEEIRKVILEKLNRGATLLKAAGVYNEDEKPVLFTNVNRRELVILENNIKNIDDQAFITVMDAKEILGNGFKSLNDV